MIIKIDTREHDLFAKCQSIIEAVPKFADIKILSQPLPLGDIIINDGTKDCIIIERKTLSDLAASIKDGRYEEQSYRLNGLNQHNHNIVYLIEGDVNKTNRFKSDNQVEKLTIYSAMFSLNYYKGFSVFRSFSMEETANIICNMAYKIGKDLSKTPFYQNKTPVIEMPINEACDTTDNVVISSKNDGEDIVPTEKDYVGVVKKVKKDNITPDNIGEIMLCQIPGISYVTAIAIMEKYHSIPNLIKELELNNDSMKDLSYTNSKGQVRKINKTCITNIVKFLLKK